MNLGISGKTALVTGGVNGIGGGITRGLLEEGCNVIATCRKEEDGNTFVSLLPLELASKLFIWVGDVSNESECLQLVEEMSLRGSAIEILVNNAGHTLNVIDPFCTLEDWRRVMRLNFEAPVQLASAFATDMISKQWGRIVNITSCAGLENSGPVTFSSAKAALTAYTRSMGRVLATLCEGVVMTAVYPGVISTKGGHWDHIAKTDPDRVSRYISERCPLGRFGEITEFVPAVLFFCSQHASFAHGSIIGIDGGQSKHYNSFNYM